MTSAAHLLAPESQPARHPQRAATGRSARRSTEPARETLRDRKKRLTREAIFESAQRLFTERGFEDVTVAEIADGANISVKTLFTYVRSKEELLFGDQPTVLDAVVNAVGNRRVGQTPLVAAANALLRAVDDEKNGLDAFRRMAVASPAARSRLRAMWDETEDNLTRVLSARRDGPRERAARRLVAAQIMVLVRTVTSDEVHDLVAGAGDGNAAGAGGAGDAGGAGNGSRRRDDALKDWIRDAAGSLARGLQSAGR